MPEAKDHDWDTQSEEAIRQSGPGEEWKPNGTKPTVRLLREREWRRMLKPPHWLVYNVIERGYVYALTARYGTGKTTVALLMSYLMAAPNFYPRLLGSLEVERGAVAIFAGENPIDVVRKAEGLRSHYGLGEIEADVFLVAGRFSIKDEADKLAAQIPKDKPLAMIVVDTAAAFFEGEEENSNAEMVGFARTLRKLTELPGNPAILCLCHPSKGSITERENMVPRGGSAFTGEIDGNLILWKLDGDRTYELDHAGKPLRSSSGFDPIRIEIASVPSIADTKGRPSSVGVAVVITDQEADSRAEQGVSNEKLVLDALVLPGTTGLQHRDLMEITSLSRSTLSGVLMRLITGHRVEKEGARFRLRTKQPNKPNKPPSQRD